MVEDYNYSSFQETQETEEEIRQNIFSIESLDIESKSKLLVVLLKNQNVFNERPGCHIDFEYHLQVEEYVIINSKQYPIPHSKRDEVREELIKWEQWDIIERAYSPYNNILHVVSKANGTVRPVLDHRALNKFVVSPRNQIDNLSDLFLSYSGSNFFYKIVSLAYFQVLLSKKIRPYTAFQFGNLQFQFKRLPFGLISSVSVL